MGFRRARLSVGQFDCTELHLGSMRLQSFQLSLRKVLGFFTVMCAVSAVWPSAGVVVFSFTLVIVGFVVLDIGVTSDEPAKEMWGIILISIGFIVAALLLAAYARLLDQ